MAHAQVVGEHSAANMAEGLWIHLGNAETRSRILTDRAYLRDQLGSELERFGVYPRHIGDAMVIPREPHEIEHALTGDDELEPEFVEGMIDGARDALRLMYGLFCRR